MVSFRRVATAACLAAACLISQPLAAQSAAPETKNLYIPYEKFTLTNGLRVLVHTERKAPVVSVAVWYHVGSKDERPGRTGFAHLFEHLMFNGTEHFNDEWFKPLEEVGATDLNGTTWFDRTNYFQTVPTTAVERVLWMESDRMGHLLGVVDQARLDEQRGVVLNEKKQGDNQPYGLLEYRQLEGLFPPGHPYRWSSIGSEADLNAAKLDDVREWFKASYGPANAVLILAGDIDTATARTLAEKYFGAIPAGNPVQRRTQWVPAKTENTRDILYDKVPQARLSRNWAVPPFRARDRVLLQLAADALGGGKTSRLYKALVFDQPLATRASFSVQPFELASMAEMVIDVRPEIDRKQAEAVAEQVLAAFLKSGPTRQELERARTTMRAGFLRGIDRMGGFSGRSSVLAEGLLYADDPGHYRQVLGWIDSATPADVRAVAQRWFASGWHQVDVVPFGERAVAASTVDRKAGLPPVATTPELTFPTLQTARLSNGIEVTLAERPGAPLVELAVVFDAGFAADDPKRPGLAGLTMGMLDEGAAGKSALEIAAAAEALGAVISAGSSLDISSVGLSALAEKLPASLDLMADIIRQPTFAPADLERLRRNLLTAIAQEKVSPQSLALRVLPPALYGPDHPYGKPLTGSGTEAAIRSFTTADLRNFHAAWLRPETARIFAAGGVSMPALTQALEAALGAWQPPASAPGTKPSLAPPPAQGVRVAIIDKPGALQSLILAGRVGSQGAAADYFDQDIANSILGGAFTSRINMNLREAKNWSYGSFSFSLDARGPRPWLVLAPVQTDRTTESIKEILSEINAFDAKSPPTAEELDRQIKSAVRSLPGGFETVRALLGRMVADSTLGRPADFVTTVKDRYEGVTQASAVKAATGEFRTDDLLWVIVGDRAKIEPGLRTLALGAVEIWNEDGEVIR